MRDYSQMIARPMMLRDSHGYFRMIPYHTSSNIDAAAPISQRRIVIRVLIRRRRRVIDFRCAGFLFHRITLRLSEMTCADYDSSRGHKNIPAMSAFDTLTTDDSAAFSYFAACRSFCPCAELGLTRHSRQMTMMRLRRGHSAPRFLSWPGAAHLSFI